uniref:Uncharacterized protein n=2 Tax=Zea mays TaxID=4577 RepID=C0P7T2_MAIZE|nr:unknown [Zea mays]
MVNPFVHSTLILPISHTSTPMVYFTLRAAEKRCRLSLLPGGCRSDNSMRNFFSKLLYYRSTFCGCLRVDAILQFQYGNLDALCPPLIQAKKNRKNLVVHVPSIIVHEICKILLEDRRSQQRNNYPCINILM